MDARLALLVAGALLAGSAHAVGRDFGSTDPGYAEPETGGGTDAHGGPADRFSRLDRNGDGALTPAEAVNDQGLANDWDLADKNGDDRLDRSEFSRFEQRMNGVRR